MVNIRCNCTSVRVRADCVCVCLCVCVVNSEVVNGANGQNVVLSVWW